MLPMYIWESPCLELGLPPSLQDCFPAAFSLISDNAATVLSAAQVGISVMFESSPFS